MVLDLKAPRPTPIAPHIAPLGRITAMHLSKPPRRSTGCTARALTMVHMSSRSICRSTVRKLARNRFSE
jgi:hypothetical protein